MKNITFVLYHPSELSNWVIKLLPYMRDCEISVLHIGHLHQIEVKSIEDAALYDISSLPYTELVSLVEKLQPCMMVFLSFRSLMELVLQRICISHGIRQVYLEHGLFSNDTLKFRKDKLKKEKKLSYKDNYSS